MSSSGPFPVIVHPFSSNIGDLYAYETGPTTACNAVIIVGGLCDGPHTLPLVRPLAKHLENARDLEYSVFEFRMRSSFLGFGTSSLTNDVADISDLVKYLRRLGREKIILFGHSTGSQDCMEYADYSKHGNEPIDGYILQGGISDREALGLTTRDPTPSLELAAKMIAEGREEDVMPNDMVPLSFIVPISAYRFYSLIAKGGDDDYFSSDIDDNTTKKLWSRFQKPVLVLHSGSDEYVPAHINQEALNKRYQQANPLVSTLSGLIPGAKHNVPEPEAQEWLSKRVADFLRTLN